MSKELSYFKFRGYGIDTSTKRKLVDAVKYLQSIGEDVSDNTIIRMNEHSNPCAVYKCLVCSHTSGLGCWTGSPSSSSVLSLSEFKKIYEEFSPIKVGDFVFICFKYSRFMYNGFVEELSDKGDIREVSVYDSKSDTHNFRTLVIDEEIETPHRVSPSNMIEIASKYNKFKNKDKMENRSKKKAFKTGDYVLLKLKNGRSVHGFVYSVSPLNVAVASGKSFKLHLGVDSSKVSHATIKPNPEFKKRYVSWLDGQDTSIIHTTKNNLENAINMAKSVIDTPYIHLNSMVAFEALVGVPVSIKTVDIETFEENEYVGVIHNVNALSGEIQFVEVYKNFVNHKVRALYLTAHSIACVSELDEDSALYNNVKDCYKSHLESSDTIPVPEKDNYLLKLLLSGCDKITSSDTDVLFIRLYTIGEWLFQGYNPTKISPENICVKIHDKTCFKGLPLSSHFPSYKEVRLATAEEVEPFMEHFKSSDTKLFKLDELNENQYVEISSVEEYKSYCEIANHLGLKWSVGLVYGEPSSAMLELLKTGEKIYISPKIGVWVEAEFIKKPKHQVISLSQIEKPTAIISMDKVTEPEFELSDNSGEFDPNKPFEVSDDGETWIDDFTHYIGVCPNMNIHFVSKTGCYDSFNFIRNTPMIKVKRSEITGVITKDGTFKNFEIID